MGYIWKLFPFSLYELSSSIDNLSTDWNRINVCDQAIVLEPCTLVGHKTNNYCENCCCVVLFNKIYKSESCLQV